MSVFKLMKIFILLNLIVLSCFAISACSVYQNIQRKCIKDGCYKEPTENTENVENFDPASKTSLEELMDISEFIINNETKDLENVENPEDAEDAETEASF